jgi:hypothetical protein
VSPGWKLRADVRDGTFTLGVEADDETAAAEHAAFADRALPLLTRADPGADPERLRASVIGYSYAAKDIDTAAVLTAVMACRMRAVELPRSDALPA